MAERAIGSILNDDSIYHGNGVFGPNGQDILASKSARIYSRKLFPQFLQKPLLAASLVLSACTGSAGSGEGRAPTATSGQSTSRACNPEEFIRNQGYQAILKDIGGNFPDNIDAIYRRDNECLSRSTSDIVAVTAFNLRLEEQKRTEEARALGNLLIDACPPNAIEEPAIVLDGQRVVVDEWWPMSQGSPIRTNPFDNDSVVGTVRRETKLLQECAVLITNTEGRFIQVRRFNGIQDGFPISTWLRTDEVNPDRSTVRVIPTPSPQPLPTSTPQIIRTPTEVPRAPTETVPPIENPSFPKEIDLGGGSKIINMGVQNGFWASADNLSILRGAVEKYANGNTFVAYFYDATADYPYLLQSVPIGAVGQEPFNFCSGRRLPGGVEMYYALNPNASRISPPSISSDIAYFLEAMRTSDGSLEPRYGGKSIVNTFINCQRIPGGMYWPRDISEVQGRLSLYKLR